MNNLGHYSLDKELLFVIVIPLENIPTLSEAEKQLKFLLTVADKEPRQNYYKLL